MADEIKRMPIKEFRERGYLHEINRLLLHPLGLALEVSVDDETGEEQLGGVWDEREDPEGIVYGDDLLNPEKAERVCQELLARREERKKHTGGWVVQPLPDHQVLSTTYTDPALRTTGREGDAGLHLSDGRFAGVELPADPPRPAPDDLERLR